MLNKRETKNPMPVQPASIRKSNFEEVALGYEEAAALDEAARCLSCKEKPCRSGCPVAIDIPAFIEKVKELDFEGAYAILQQSSSLPAVCGRVCPQEVQCESKCVRGRNGEPVAIGRLERFVADRHMAISGKPPAKPASNGARVAVIGSGPAGLTCAGDLAKRGFEVTVFEALHTPGGVLVYGIPQFRLPKEIVAREVDTLRALGVQIVTNVIIGKSMTIDDLFADGYEAVFIGSGAGLPTFMQIPGETLKGVYSANEYLTRINLMKAYRADSDTPIVSGRRVAVVGGGNVAMDAARCALRMGAEEVSIVYRRSMKELPARKEEVEHAEEEGVVFRTLVNPVEVLGDEHRQVRALRVVEMELGEPDASGRRRPVEKKDSAYEISVDCVIMALGTSPNPLLRMTTEGLDADRKGCLIAVNEAGLTTRAHVYAGGDALTGAATVILAMGAGKSAAAAIAEELRPVKE